MTQSIREVVLPRKLTQEQINRICEAYPGDERGTFLVNIQENKYGTHTLSVSYNPQYTGDTDTELMLEAPSALSIRCMAMECGFPVMNQDEVPWATPFQGKRYYFIRTLLQVNMVYALEKLDTSGDPYYKVPDDVWLPSYLTFEETQDGDKKPVWVSTEDMEAQIGKVERGIAILKQQIETWRFQ